MLVAGRVYLRGAVLVGATALSVWPGVSGCQFPDYDLPRGGSGQSGSGADAGSSLGGVSAAGMGSPGGADAAGDGSGGASTPIVACGLGLVCTAGVPAGWLGPVAHWQGKAGTEQPDCPDGYADAVDLHAGLLAPDAECSCTCTPKGQVCDKGADVSVFTDMGCKNECFHASPLACTAVSGCDGSQGTVRADPPKPSGTCQAKVTTHVPDTVSWQYDARLCTLETAEPGSCTGDGELCTPTPGAPYASQLCVFRIVPEGQELPECPSEYPHAREPLYESFTDERGCSSCSCTGLIGGSCAGTLTLGTTGQSCGTGFEYKLGSGCLSFGFATPPVQLDAEYTLMPATCGIARDTEPTGGALPSGSATVVCCL
ncbi:MAG: hypothetical protein ABUL60_15755 [Myxococcales bacterium]